MLSCRQRGRHVLKPSTLSRRANARSYSNKVRVFPFVGSKEQAISRLSCTAAVLTGSKLVSTFLRHLFPSLDLDALRPTSVQPAYIPTWLVDAELEATIWAKKQITDDHLTKDTAQIQFGHTVFPGFIYKPLSNLNFMTPALLESKTVPWSDDLRKQGEDQVICPPFTLTPFRVPDALRSTPAEKAAVADILRFEPASLKETMMAAYPVLIPVYLAQYTAKMPVNDEEKDVTISAFIEAGVPDGRTAGEPVPLLKEFMNLFGMDAPDLVIGGAQKELVRQFTNVRSLTAHNVTLRHRALVEAHANLALGSNDALQCYQERFFSGAPTSSAGSPAQKSAVDWTDARIRPFEAEERHANLQWLATSADLFLLKTMLQVYNTRREGQGQQPQEGAPVVQESEIEWVKTQIATAEKAREERKPAWLAAYELQERLLEPSHTKSKQGEGGAHAQTPEQQPQ